MQTVLDTISSHLRQAEQVRVQGISPEPIGLEMYRREEPPENVFKVKQRDNICLFAWRKL